MSITDFIIWNNLINNNSYNDPIEVSPAFEAFLSYLLVGIAITVTVIAVIFIGILLWGVLGVAWDWLKDKYDTWKCLK